MFGAKGRERWMKLSVSAAMLGRTEGDCRVQLEGEEGGRRQEVVQARNAAAGRGGRKEGLVSRPLRDAVPPIFAADFVICGWRDRLGLCALRLADSAISRQSVAQTGTSIQTPPSCGLTLQG